MNPSGKHSAGFLMSLEAAASLILIAISLHALQLFEARGGSEGAFYLCSDAALALSKTNAFSSAALLEEKTSEAAGLSGTCIFSETDSFFASTCGAPPGSREVHAFSFPAWSERKVATARVYCWERQ